MAKIIKYDELSNEQKSWKEQTTVLVGGCFDIFHYGHLKFLQKARERGDFLIVLLESDRFIKENKKKIPVHSQVQRAEILAAIEYVDMVILLPYLDKRDVQYPKLTEIIHPDVIAITEGDKFMIKKQQQAIKIGAQLEVVTPLLKEFSSSKIINYEAIFSD